MAGTNDELRARVRAVIADLSPRRRDAVSPADRLLEDLGYDSLAMVELSAELEAQFVLTEVDAGQAAAVTTVAELEDVILTAARTG